MVVLLLVLEQIKCQGLLRSRLWVMLLLLELLPEGLSRLLQLLPEGLPWLLLDTRPLRLERGLHLE